LLRRKINSNKSDFGHILILAGSGRYSGAAALCASAALRSGAGLVILGIPKSLNTALIKIKPLEAITLSLDETPEATLSNKAYAKIRDFAKKADCLVIGPGLSQNKSTQALVRKLVQNIKKPMVIDADGLNALVNHLNILPAANNQRPVTVLTPHPGEMARLLGIPVRKVQENRKRIAVKFANDNKLTLVLKSHGTIVSDDIGNYYLNKTGNPGMSSAGTGDVLTGMIAAFIGQGLDGFNAAKYAVYLHGLAGDLAAKEKTQISLIASDIIAKIPEAIKRNN